MTKPLISPESPRVHEVEARITAHDPAASGYRRLDLAMPQEALGCRPGQFFHILCPVDGQHQPFLRRPMSIYGYDRAAGRLSFLYKVAGTGTAALARLLPGARVNVLGPLGTGFSIPARARHLVLVARGVGLATLAPLAQEARARDLGLVAICSARSPAHLLSIDHFRALGARVIAVTDREGNSAPAQIRPLLERLIAEGRADMLYTCGSNRLLELCQQVGQSAGIPGEVALEQQMACGLGMCQCCVRPLRRNGQIVHERVCREGPVFNMQEALGW